MHQRYARDGLVCMSVCVDEPKRRAAALDFLRDQRAPFANYLLREEIALWQEKFDVSGPPAVFVFNRDGKRAGKFDCNDPDKPYTNADVEQLVRSLLRTPAP
jgi:hypothetical protein